MEQKAQWLIEDQIILHTFVGEQNVERHRKIMKESYDLTTNSLYKPVHIIVDTRKVTYDLPLSDSMRVAREFESENVVGHTVLVGRLSLEAKLGTTVSKVFSNFKFHNVKSLIDAIAYLKEKEPDLNWHQLKQELITE